MRTLLLRFLYGYYQACAYLASYTDGQYHQGEYQSTADEYYRLWCREQIQ